eukprot:TRINITY_DN67876_c0_g1_i1.p1 TRINITY_DN67876_c0_g1~~TRINITY_DN67876_c0_g1_i1.p1  ORF type:complete len:427 (-),score=83.70 TRINITY_DN67876_c0_g1_i1:176-1363(-)
MEIAALRAENSTLRAAAASNTTPPTDHDAKCKAASGKVFGLLGSSLTAAMVYVGDQLGLYSKLASLGKPVTSEEFAESEALHERWVREWMNQQAAAGILKLEPGSKDRNRCRFSIDPAYADALSNSDSPYFSLGMFGALPSLMARAKILPDVFKISEKSISGIGMPYNEADISAACNRSNMHTFRNTVLPKVIPRLQGGAAAARMEAGCKVADVGCGAAGLLLELARAYPLCEFHGYDVSAEALELAAANIEAAGLEGRIKLHQVADEPISAMARDPFHVVFSFDVLHDATDPDAIIRETRAGVADDGCWCIADIKCKADIESNICEIAGADMMYGFSVCLCMSSALSKAGGAGLGTLGFSPQLAEPMFKGGGFSRFEVFEIEKCEQNFFFEVAP